MKKKIKEKLNSDFDCSVNWKRRKIGSWSGYFAFTFVGLFIGLVIVIHKLSDNIQMFSWKFSFDSNNVWIFQFIFHRVNNEYGFEFRLTIHQLMIIDFKLNLCEMKSSYQFSCSIALKAYLLSQRAYKIQCAWCLH